MNTLSTVAQLSNEDLMARVKHLAGRERAVTMDLIAHLAELDARRLYLAEGCASLFTYCTQILQLSEHAAYGRIEAARASRKFPLILEGLGDGSLNLTTVCLLGPHLTPENHREVLDMAQHKSKRQVEELVARLRPQPPVPDTVRRLPIREAAVSHTPASRTALQEPAPGPSPDGSARAVLASGPPVAASAPSPARRAVVTPLAPQQYKVVFTASAELHEKLQQAQALLRHQIPNGDLSAVFDRALTALLKELAKNKLAATERPRASRGTARGSRHIPAEVKRAVWRRDGHVVPYAVGGPATVENIQLWCRAHNGYEAERNFGPRSSLVARERHASYAHVARERRSPSYRESAQLGPGRVRRRARLCSHAQHVDHLVDGFLSPPGLGRT